MFVLAIRLFVIRVSNTWTLMWQSFRVIREYRALTLLPIISWAFCLLTSIIVLGGGSLILDLQPSASNFVPSRPRISMESMQQLTAAMIEGLLGDPDLSQDAAPLTPTQRKAVEHVQLILFLLYLANSCVITFFN